MCSQYLFFGKAKISLLLVRENLQLEPTHDYYQTIWFHARERERGGQYIRTDLIMQNLLKQIRRIYGVTEN